MSFRQLIVLVGCAVALLAVPSAIATANGLSWDPSNPLPSDISVAAAENTPSQTVTWTDPVALDASSNPFPATCSPTSGSSFLLGTMPVTCSADDGVGDTISDSFNVTVGPDSTPPVLQNVPSNQTIEVVGPVPGTFSYSISATDNVTPSCTSPYGLTGGSFPYATTTVTCIADDSTGNVDTGSFTVTVQDTIKPTIGPHADVPVTVPTTPAAVTYTNPTTSEPAVVTCAPASGSSFPSGTTTVTCNATDAAGNPAVSATTFRVVVTDNTPPAVSITGGPASLVNVRTASLSFTTSEGTTSCQLDGGAFGACGSPANYSGLADGAHTFAVKATDAAGNNTTASRGWTVDATGPVLSLPSTRVGEADGPNGAVASFSVTASDAGTALLPSAVRCIPGSATLFPIGTTTVTCQATDAAGNVGSGSFDVIIQDTTAPAINAPNVSFTATSANGTLKTDPDVVAYLAGISATDLVSTPTLTNDMPAVLPIGVTTVIFTAKDAAGNIAKKSVTVTILPLGQKAPPPDLTPPGDVSGAKAIASDRTIKLSWNQPGKDVGYVAVTQFVVGEAGTGREIFSGPGTTVTAKNLVNGTAYRFLIVAYDQAGNRSKGLVVVATPKAEALTSPKQAERVSRPPLLRWAPVAAASYYNVQLWRGSTKVLSMWPTTTRLQLTAKWTFSGKARKLSAGLYTWYVWPGVGARADAKYGSLLGSRTFTFAPKKKPKKK